MFTHLRNLTKFFPRKLNLLFIISLIFSIFASLIETIGLSTIPIFISLIADPLLVESQLRKINLNYDIASIDKIILSAYVSLGLVIIFLIKNIIILGINYIQLRLMKAITVFLGSKLFRNYTGISYEQFVTQNTSTLTRNLVSEVTQVNSFFTSLMKIVRDFFLFIFIFIFLMAYDPYISSIIFITVGSVVGLIIFFTRNPIKNFSIIALDKRSIWFQSITEGLKSVKFSKVTFAHNFLNTKFEESITNVERYRLKAKFLANVPRLLIEVAGISTLLAISLSFYFLNMDPALLLSSLAVTGIALVRLLPTFNTLASELALISSQLPSVELIVNDLKEKIDTDYLLKKSQKTHVFKESINFHDVSYQYPESTSRVLKNLNLAIHYGDHIGVMGSSGSGKTTLVDLILGLIKPTKGSILVDNLKLDETKLNFSYAPQEVFMLDASIKDNILFGEKENNERYQSILKDMDIDDLESDLSNNSEYRLGDSGSLISGGQRQRIGLARALYREPEILIIDEGTNALDRTTELKVLNNLHQIMRGKTIIFIAHNESSLEFCNKIIYIENQNLEIRDN